MQREDFEGVVEKLMTDSLGAELASRLLHRPVRS